jgi:cellulose synthase/poly-beta-1,6-N-acetylglucosamine synthase-like glycosyltransferase
MPELLFFWLPLMLLVYSYMGFPLLLLLLVGKKHNNTDTFNQTDDLPTVSVLISVYNEEKSIEQRIRNIYATNYPLKKIEVLVGSDGSNDNTNYILKQLQDEYPTLKVEIYGRIGKAGVLNQLYKHAANEILILTDAKVLISPHTIFQLVKHFKNKQIGIVGGNIINKKYSPDGISIPEKAFMSYEIMMKYNEGVIWGVTIGVYGACYAMPRQLFKSFPAAWVVDDFFQNMQVLDLGKSAIIEKNALCYEEVPNQLEEEFRRKTRISVGNFQNLAYFKHLLWKRGPLSFCFFSHKLLRWIGPFLLLLVFISNCLLICKNLFYLYFFVIQAIALLIPIIDYFLRNIRRDIIILRFVTHFYLMNIALAIGFVKYLKGVKSNVWEPTKR